MCNKFTEEALREHMPLCCIQNALDERSEKNMEIKEIDHIFKMSMMEIRNEFQKTGSDLIPCLLDIEECYYKQRSNTEEYYKDQRMICLLVVSTALTNKKMALRLAEVVRDWYDETEYQILKDIVSRMPLINNQNDDVPK